MRPTPHLLVLALAPLAGPVHGGERLEPTIDLSDMRIVLVYVSTGELVNLQRKHGAHIDVRDIRQDHRHGVSILKTDHGTGARTCEIYLPKDKRPRQVDDEGTLILGHELLHCMLGNYHR